jgi:mono/diheme cytochrome c family protein
MKFILCVSSLAVILFSGLYLYRENITPEWRGHQLDYIEQIGKNSEPFVPELRQIWLPKMNRVDRCVSCHLALEDPGFEKGMNPIKFHPKDYLNKHDTGKLGCTICHDGQGRAVNVKDAHADKNDVFWDKPLLRKPFIEANCYHCHIDLLDQTPEYNRGKKLFEKSGCLGCHKRDGRGGMAGPKLSGIADASTHIKYPTKSFDPNIYAQLFENKNLAYIYEAILFPKAQPEDSPMFDFKLPHKDVLAMTLYLKSLGGMKTGLDRISPKPVSPLSIIEKGKRAFGLYCTACHGKNGRGGVKNPNYIDDYIPALNTLSEKMFLYKQENRDAVILILTEFDDLLQAGAQPDIPGFFKTIAKYMPVKNIILRGRIVEKKNPKGPGALNMPTWEKTLTPKEVSAIIAYLISVY